MANYLIFKGKETKSIDSVQYDLPNYEVTQLYTNFKEITASIASSGTLDLGTPETLPSTTPFIVLISDQEVDLAFVDADDATIDSLTNIYYIAGNFKGYNFNLTNNSSETANITFRIYW